MTITQWSCFRGVPDELLIIIASSAEQPETAQGVPNAVPQLHRRLQCLLALHDSRESTGAIAVASLSREPPYSKTHPRPSLSHGRHPTNAAPSTRCRRVVALSPRTKFTVNHDWAAD